jgi:hypothetical protein
MDIPSNAVLTSTVPLSLIKAIVRNSLLGDIRDIPENNGAKPNSTAGGQRYPSGIL